MAEHPSRMHRTRSVVSSCPRGLSRKQEEIHATYAPASNTIGILVDEDEKTNAVLNIGAKGGVLGPLVDVDDVAGFTGNGEVGKTETWAVGVACFAAVEGIARWARDGNDILTGIGNVSLRREDTDRSTRASDGFGFGGNGGLRLRGNQ